MSITRSSCQRHVGRRHFLCAAAMTSAAAMLSPSVGWPQTPSEKPLALDDGSFVDINGVEQWITIRGRDVKNPVLLWLAGGPGAGMSNLAPAFFDWEQYFTVVQWDQPASGATGLKNANLPTGPLTIDRYVSDGLAVADYVRKRLNKDKIVLIGISFGTILGVEMVHRRPELFSAYVGCSQAVGSESWRVGYELGLKSARDRGDQVAVDALEKVGPPPYRTLEEFFVREAYTNPPGEPPSPREVAATAAFNALMRQPVAHAHYDAGLSVPANYQGGFIATQRATFQETAAWEARRLDLRFQMPVFIIQGENDFNTPTAVSRAYFDEIKAPKKAFTVVPGASHNLVFFHDDILTVLKREVLPALKRR